MLGTRTKQVFSYGKRNQRVVNVTDEREMKDLFPPLEPSAVPRAPVKSRMRRREDGPSTSKPHSPSPRVVKVRRKKKRLSATPLPPRILPTIQKSKIISNANGDDIRKKNLAARLPRDEMAVEMDTPPRPPLAVYPVNLPSSPIIVSRPIVQKKPIPHRSNLLRSRKSSSPFVDVEILVFDQDGRKVSQERRVSRTDVIMNPIGTRLAGGAKNTKIAKQVVKLAQKSKQPSVDTCDSTDVSPVPKPLRRVARRAKANIIVSDESGSDERSEDSEISQKSSTSSSRDDFQVRRVSRRVTANTIISEESRSEEHLKDSGTSRKFSASLSRDVPDIRRVSMQPLEGGPRKRLSRRVAPAELTLDSEASDTFSVSEASPPPKPFCSNPRRSPVVPAPVPRKQGYQHFSSPLPRPRQLTPIRNAAGMRSWNHFERSALPSPSTPTDAELSLEFSDLDLNLNDLSSIFPRSNGQVGVKGVHVEPPPEYLMPLLAECAQETSGPHEFSAFIEMFPLDPIVRMSSDGEKARDATFRKIGEASYSEVFGIGDVVLKIIPLRDESAKSRVKRPTPTQAWGKTKSKRTVFTSEAEQEGNDGPLPSDAKDVLREIIVTDAMGDLCDGFVRLLRTYVVRGRYPEKLLQLWDEYFERKGSENARPDTFGVSQVYAIIVLPNGGPDLEAYAFSNGNKYGWRQACSIFWQIARALGRAEQLVSFEHRDLHWGQILVRNIPPKIPPSALIKSVPTGKALLPVSLDLPAYGVRATIIDLGLSRMDAEDGVGGERVHWTPFAEEIFMGEGDYQFDVYRIMRDHIQGAWEDFKPLTNVMWLHYLALKLLHSKHLRPPPAASQTSLPSMSAQDRLIERNCYDGLTEIERVLGQSVDVLRRGAGAKAKKGRKGRPPISAKPAALEIGPQSASEIVEYAMKRSWLR